jgi:hypothetical protein
MITSVKVNGTAIDLTTIAYDVSISVGRRDTTTDYAPSSCRITFYNVSATSYTGFVGQTLAVQGNPWLLFGGFITDVRLTVESTTSGARCDIIAAGPSSRLGTLNVGTSGYPAQTVRARLGQIAADTTAQSSSLTFSGETGLDEGEYNLSAYTAGTTDALALMTDTVNPIGGVIYDNPGAGGTIGKIAYHTVDRTPSSTLSPTSTTVLWSPTFDQSGQVINDLNVFSDAGTVSRSNTDSQTLYGKRTRDVTTRIADITNATDLADELIGRLRRPRWAISDVTIDQSLTAPEQLFSSIGNKLVITNLPTGSPFTTYTGYVQGWEHRIANETFRTTFYLADPADVGHTLAWNEIPNSTAYKWNTIRAATIWDNALTLSDITA